MQFTVPAVTQGSHGWQNAGVCHGRPCDAPERIGLDQSGMTPWRRAVIVAVALAWVAALVVVERQARDEADSKQEVLATQAAVLIDGTATSSLTAMAGAGGLVNKRGNVDLGSFQTYAQEVVDVSPITTLGFEPVVAHADRAAFEEELG